MKKAIMMMLLLVLGGWGMFSVFESADTITDQELDQIPAIDITENIDSEISKKDANESTIEDISKNKIPNSNIGENSTIEVNPVPKKDQNIDLESKATENQVRVISVEKLFHLKLLFSQLEKQVGKKIDSAFEKRQLKKAAGRYQGKFLTQDSNEYQVWLNIESSSLNEGMKDFGAVELIVEKNGIEVVNTQNSHLTSAIKALQGDRFIINSTLSNKLNKEQSYYFLKLQKVKSNFIGDVVFYEQGKTRYLSQINLTHQ